MLETVRVIEIPAGKWVSSPAAMFGEGPLERFDTWFSAFPRTQHPRDYLSYDESRQGFVWHYQFSEGMEFPAEFTLDDFPGGLYLVVCGVDAQDSSDVYAAMDEFLQAHPQLERDPTRRDLGNIITPPQATAALGYNQMDFYQPVRVRTEG